MHSNDSSLKGFELMKGLLSSWWVMSLAEGNFSSSSRMISTAMVKEASVGTGVEIGFGQVGSWQTIFEGVGLTMMDLDWCLHYLSRNPALKFVAMSHSSSTQTMGGATRSSLVSGSLLVVEEDEDEKEDDVDGKDKRVGGRVLTPWVGRVVGYFFLFCEMMSSRIGGQVTCSWGLPQRPFLTLLLPLL